MANNYTHSLNVASTDFLLAPAASFINVDNSAATAQVHNIEVPEYYKEPEAKLAFKLFMKNGWSNTFMLNVNGTGNVYVKTYVSGTKTDIPATGAAGTVLELFYDGTDYVVFRGL